MISDRTYLRRILQNLISNAVRYTETGGVFVALRQRRDGLFVEVRDSGPGIAEADQDSIFHEFHRLNAKASASEGMGLGLAIVERAAAVLGHPLTLRSAPGCGSTFSLGLKPALGQVARIEDDPVAVARDPEGGDIVVLLVENDAELSRAMTQLLEKWGVTVLDVSSGEEALELLEATGLEPDACLIDFQLGDGMDGLALIEELRARRSDVPVRLVTADRSEALRKRAQPAQVEILTKPVPTAQLAAFLFGSGR